MKVTILVWAPIKRRPCRARRCLAVVSSAELAIEAMLPATMGANQMETARAGSRKPECRAPEIFHSFSQLRNQRIDTI